MRSRSAIFGLLQRRSVGLLFVALSFGLDPLAAQTSSEWGGAQPGIREPTTAERDRFDELTRSLCRGAGRSAAAGKREAEQILRRTYGEHHPAFARFLLCSTTADGLRLNMAAALGPLERAKALLESLPAAQRQDYPVIMDALASFYVGLGRTEEALALVDRRLASAGQIRSGNEAFTVGNLLSDRVDLLLIMGRLQQAEADARQRLALLTEYRQEEVDLVPAERALATVLLAEGSNVEAYRIAAIAYSTHRETLRGNPNGFEGFVETGLVVSRALQATGRSQEAERILSGLDQSRRDFERNDFSVGDAEEQIVRGFYWNYLSSGRYAEAAAKAGELLGFAQQADSSSPPNPMVTASLRALRGLARCGAGDIAGSRADFSAAGPMFQALDTFMSQPATAPWLSFRAECELRAGDRAAAIALARRAAVANWALLRGAARDANLAESAFLSAAAPAGLTLLTAQWSGSAGHLNEEQFEAVQQIRPSAAEAAALEAAAASRARAAGSGPLIEQYRLADMALKDVDQTLTARVNFIVQADRRRDAARQVLRAAAPNRSLAEFSSTERADYDAAQAQITEAEAPLDDLRRRRTQAAARLASFAQSTDPGLRDYMAARRGAGVTLGTAGSLLRPDEALVVLTPGTQSQRGFVMVITAQGPPAWAQLPVSTEALSSSIERLRLGLRSGGRTLPPDARSGTAGPGGFDRQEAHRLYGLLFGDPAIAAALRGRERWIVVPQGVFLSLPFATLVMDEPPGGVAGNAVPDSLRQTAWLGTSRILSVLPSVSALAALHGPVSPGRGAGELRLFAIGNPDMAAWQRRLAADPILREVVPSSRRDAILAMPGLGTTEVNVLQARFPASDSPPLLGGDATEGHMRQRGAQMAAADVVLFATHSLLGGNMFDSLEPALLLSPPAASAPGTTYSQAFSNDGILTASEVERLTLSADWVVLSACDTAAGQAGGDGLSGLARAFFSAGARSLLVSQWSVEDTAAADLVERTITRWVAAHASKSDALREAMRALLNDRSGDENGVSTAHPARWAAFEYIGGE